MCLLTVMAGGNVLRAESADSRPWPPNRVEVLLTTSDTLSPSARTALVRETESIWRRQGVAIHWLPPNDPSPPGKDRLRAIIVEKRSIPAAKGAFAIGELVGSTGNHPIAFISIEDAQRLVTYTRGRMGYDILELEERRLGVTLGRALAHEIGHFLLRTKTHARTGLMRSQFHAAEFTDLRDGTFALDRAAAAWLRMRNAEKFAVLSPLIPSCWRQHGVLLDWLDPSAVRPVASNRLRVLIVHKSLVSRWGTRVGRCWRARASS